MNYWVLDRIICFMDSGGAYWNMMQPPQPLVPGPICSYAKEQWAWVGVTYYKNQWGRAPCVCLQCLTVLRYSHNCQSALRDLGCLSLHPSASLRLLEMEIKAVSCWFKKCHSFLPLKCFNNAKSLNLLLKMMMDISEQRFWGSLNFSNVHKSTA